MKRFSTDEFRFDLPGDDWVEATLQMYMPPGDDSSVFAISRSARSGEVGDVIARGLRAFPKSPDVEVEVVRSEPGKLGPLGGWDTGFITRTRKSADYTRLVTVGYYDVELHFCWGGPASERTQVDARAERSMETVRFLRR